jgi:predicted nucleic acid-binding protein
VTWTSVTEVSLLLDTNVVSEATRKRPNPQVLAWMRASRHEATYISALVLGELRYGVERVRRHDPQQAAVREAWLQQLEDAYKDQIVPVDSKVADVWGRISVPDPLPRIDGLMAATALAHDWTFVTRNTKHVERTGVRLVNPWDDAGAS